MSSHSIQSIKISSESLKKFISEFRTDINSTRCESRISSLSDLLNILIKRNLLNIRSYEILLQNILSTLQPLELNIVKNFLVTNLENNDYFNGQNIYALQKMENESLVKPQNYDVHRSTLTRDQTHHLMFKIIANEIEDWRDFARELDITESQIVEFEEMRLNISTIVHRILENAKQNYGLDINCKIKSALIEVKRKDIVRKLISKGLIS